MKDPEQHNEYIDYLKSLIEVLPEKPGVYQYIDRYGEIIYIGKAANLKKRVTSYFTKSKYENYKLKVLVKKISDIRHIVVSSESDALLLENNLIKKYQPRYNVLLKDDKSFPWICVKKEPYPRVFSTRNVIYDGSVYYGPYTSVNMVRTMIEMIRQLFPLRNCNLNLTDENINSRKFKVCLEYHIGNCKGPCIGLQPSEEYEESLKYIHQILKGNIYQVIEYLKKMMKYYAAEQKYEQAQVIKEKIDILEKYKSKSTIVNPKITNADVFSIAEDENYAFVNCLRMINGSIIQAHTLELRKKLDETTEELLLLAIVDIRQKFGSNPKEIIIPVRINFPLYNVKFTIPKKGDKKQLLELSERNVKIYMLEKRKQRELLQTAARANRILGKLKDDLRLKELPVTIECFDNSNIQGYEPVAACVVFRNTRPSKKDYRYFNIKSVSGPDDYASMEEIVYRRYKRMIAEKKNLPQLVIIDGGKGQLNSAVKSLEALNLKGKIAIIGIAKRLEEIYFPADSVPMYLDKKSETLKLIQQIRNEAHRFGITLHRKKRIKSMTGSELDLISGIGVKTKEMLLKQFGSVKGIKQADHEIIINLIGPKRANLVIKGLE